MMAVIIKYVPQENKTANLCAPPYSFLAIHSGATAMYMHA